MTLPTDTVFVFDIETAPTDDPAVVSSIASSIKPPGNMKKEETIAAWEAHQKPTAVIDAVARTALDGGRGSVIAIGWAVITLDHDHRLAGFTTNRMRIRGRDESVQNFLGDTFRAMGDDIEVPYQLAGHNILDFDIPFLIHQCIRHRLTVPRWLPIFPSPYTNDVLDTMRLWAGVRGQVGLSDLAQSLGIERAETIPSHQVPQAWQAGDVSAVAAHLDDDVLTTVKVLHDVLDAMGDRLAREVKRR